MSWEDKAAEGTQSPVDIYIEHFGNIPENYRVHHIDNNLDNNNPNNLIALPYGFYKNIHSDYAFYHNIAASGMLDKKLLQALLDYYSIQGYSLNKRFSRVLVEFFLSKYKPSLGNESPIIKPQNAILLKKATILLKKVKGTLAPYYKQNDLLFGSNGIYAKLSEKQVESCLRKVLESVSELYSEIKKGRL